MKKRVFCLVLILLMLLPFGVSAEENITVYVNGVQLEAPIAARTVNDRTVLPMRAVFEALGAKVTWFESNQLIFATKDENLITLKIGAYEMILQKISSTKPEIISLDVAPFIVDDYTLVPVRAVAEALNADVTWVEETQQVLINTEK